MCVRALFIAGLHIPILYTLTTLHIALIVRKAIIVEAYEKRFLSSRLIYHEKITKSTI